MIVTNKYERFADKVQFTDTCWLWMANADRKGYGRFWADGYKGLAHRWAYQTFVGPIPEGLQLDHLCRVPACVRPEHLEPVTQQENIDRGLRGRGKVRKQFHFCGNEYTLFPKATVVRVCVPCRDKRVGEWRAANPERDRELSRLRQRRYRERKREAASQCA